MRLFLFLFLTSLPAHASWTVKSEFQLLLNEKIFDKMIADFGQSLQGQQAIPIGDFTVTPGGIPIQIQGVRAEVNYSFPAPKRVDDRTREWDLHSDQLSARLLVNKISATQTIVREIDGIIIRIRLQAECNNVVLRLPPGRTTVQARIRAELAQSQIKLSLPSYEAHWQEGAWQVESMQCSGIEGFENIVKAEALRALSSFQNFDAEVRTALNENFEKWSKDASLLLLSERELPSNKDYVKIFYEPKFAYETGAGVLLGGTIRFDYPFVAPDQTIEHVYELNNAALSQEGEQPQLLLPFATVRALMMGEYFAGKLEYSLRSYEIPAFQEFMQSRWKQFWAWPELRRFAKNTTFAFQFLPLGPPAITDEQKGANNSIQGKLDIPLSVRVFAPLEGKYRPMVEFRTRVAGSTNLRLTDKGQIEMQLTAEEHPVNYAWSTDYVKKYNPTKRIAVETITSQIRESMGTKGFTLAIPTLKVGKSLELVPQQWNLDGKNLKLDFIAK